MLYSFGFTKPIYTSICADCLIGAGIIGSLLAGLLMARTHRFKLILACVCGIGAVTLVINTFLYYTEKFWAIAIGFLLVGFFTIPSTSVAIEYGCEIAYPIPPAAIAGTILSCGYFAASTVIFICGLILKTTTPRRTFVIIHLVAAAMLVIGFVMALIME